MHLAYEEQRGPQLWFSEMFCHHVCKLCSVFAVAYLDLLRPNPLNEPVEVDLMGPWQVTQCTRPTLEEDLDNSLIVLGDDQSSMVT